jgi:hypothetical protein
MTSEGVRISSSPATIYPLEQGNHIADDEPEQEVTTDTVPDDELEGDSAVEPEGLSADDERRQELERKLRQVPDLLDNDVGD